MFHKSAGTQYSCRPVKACTSLANYGMQEKIAPLLADLDAVLIKPGS